MSKKQQHIHLFFHLPDDRDALREIQRRIAKVQAEAVLKYVDSLRSPPCQKQNLVDDIIFDANASAKKARKERLSFLPEDVTIVWEKCQSKRPKR